MARIRSVRARMLPVAIVHVFGSCAETGAVVLAITFTFDS